MISQEDHDAIKTAIALLRQYKLLHALSFMITLSGSVVLLLLALGHDIKLYWIVVVVLVVITGVVESFFALRIAFDIELLKALIQTDEPSQRSLARLDRSLLRLGLISNDKVGRDLNSRLSGCFRLFRRQGFISAIQLLILLVAAFLQLLVIG